MVKRPGKGWVISIETLGSEEFPREEYHAWVTYKGRVMLDAVYINYESAMRAAEKVYNDSTGVA